MRKLFIPLIAFLLLFSIFPGCKKLASAIFGGTDFNVPTAEFTIPILFAVAGTEQSFGTYNQNINLDSTIKAKTGGLFGVGDVSSIKVRQVNLSVDNSDALNNLSNFETVRVTLGSDVQTNPVELFTFNFPETNTSTYSFTPTNSPELLPYLRGRVITYSIFGKNRRITTKPLTLRVDVTLRAN